MSLLLQCSSVLSSINQALAYPSLIIFLGTGFILTLQTRFLQIRGFPYFFRLLLQGVTEKHTTAKTISPIRALFSAMATTIGMGNIVGPSIAISVGGPGALFWLLIYIIIGSATKFTEVTYAVYSRTTSEAGDIIGGPTQYLKMASLKLAAWYGIATIILFTGWSSLQVNTLACIWAQEGIPHWITGLSASSLLLIVVLGGVQRISFFASRIVPLKFILYVGFAIVILLKDPAGVVSAISLVISSAFKPISALGGFLGASAFSALREGIYKGIFITESGIGTSSISHALSDVKRPTDQGVLALYSGLADMFLCTLSGLLTIVTGLWTSGKLTNTLVYEAFKLHAPLGGKWALVASIFLFVITALIGNTYNGSQSFASVFGYRYVRLYFIVAAFIAFLGSLANVPLLWQLMDIILVLVAIPNLIGLLYIAYKYPHVLDVKNNSYFQAERNIP